YGNAILDEAGNFKKVPAAGLSEKLWQEMVAYANERGWKSGDYKKLNLPFENKIMGQPQAIRERMAKRVENFVYTLLTEVFNAADTAPLGIKAILAAGSYDLGPKSGRLENPAEWTGDRIAARAAQLGTDKGPAGNFED
ncbi:MAG: ketose-bisphosphate aldolase, partial [Deltaproteobacteria bacterium CG_4_10_14_3_um_filter_60_8]